ncbi:MAG TPA: SigB/SigF/SigG family RNA polymerase sigma factor [Abditibacterium sp.]|jgi:RNA polymerase sigma-B factor
MDSPRSFPTNDHSSTECGIVTPVPVEADKIENEADVAEIDVTVEAEAETLQVAPQNSAAQQRADTHADFDVLFKLWKEHNDPQLRERLILSQRNLVTYLARRFLDRGEMFEDVMQIGMVGLINALDGFDPARGVKFSTFAIPTISGEIRRYFRDKVWGMRVPRRMQEMYGVIQNHVEELTQKLDRAPTYAEIASSLQITVEEVVETMELGNALDPQSLDDPVFGEEGTALTDTVGALDPDLQAYEEHAALQMALARLSAKERTVLEMAYFQGFSQADIARRLGVSQMHISRLLRRSLAQLRNLLEDG